MVNDRQNLDLSTFASPAGGADVEWRISDLPEPYPEAVAVMEQRATDIAAHRASELVWLLEHPPLLTSGTSGKPGDLLDPRFPVYPTGRGGQLTYHGPGQRGGLCDARSEAAAAGRSRLRRRAGAMDHPHACRVQCARRTSRGPRRRLGREARPRAPATRTKSPRSACGCGTGCRSTASLSMSSLTCRTFLPSCPAASSITAMASHRWSISASPSPWRMSTSHSGRLLRKCSGRRRQAGRKQRVDQFRQLRLRVSPPKTLSIYRSNYLHFQFFRLCYSGREQHGPASHDRQDHHYGVSQRSFHARGPDLGSIRSQMGIDWPGRPLLMLLRNPGGSARAEVSESPPDATGRGCGAPPTTVTPHRTTQFSRIDRPCGGAGPFLESGIPAGFFTAFGLDVARPSPERAEGASGYFLVPSPLVEEG